MTPLPPGSGSLVALGAKQLVAFRNRNEVKNLLSIVAADVAKTPGVTPEKVHDVKNLISGLRVDPAVMGALKRLLDAGDTTATPLLQKRLKEILTFGDPELDSLELPRITARSFEANVSMGKRDEKGVARVEGQMTRSFMREQFAGLRQEMKSGFGDLRATEAASAGKAMSEFGFSQGTARILEDLKSTDPRSAEQLAFALEAGGVGRARELIENEQDWMSDGGAELWVALGKTADRAGDFGPAEAAYLRAAEMPDVADRARQLVRASGSAALGGDDKRSEVLLVRAKEIDAQNPAITITIARQAEDPDEVMDMLDGVDPVDDSQAALLELTRAGAESARQNIQAAKRHVAAARELHPDSPMVEEVSANIVLFAALGGLPDEVTPDRSELADVGEKLASLGEELADDGRTAGAAAVLARASQACSLAEERSRASELLQRALDMENQSDAAETLGEAALLLQRFELIDSLELGDDEPARLMRATARVLGETDVRGAAEDLDLLLESEDENIASRAAFMRLAAASPVHGVDWSDTAEQVVAEQKPEAVAVLKAEFLGEGDQIDAAEKALAPFSSSTQPLRYLTGLAVRRRDYEAALRLSEELISRKDDPRDRLDHAGLLARSGDRKTARDRFLMIARDASLPGEIRGQAYGRGANLAMEIGDLLELARVSEEWLSFDPAEEDAVWLHLFALARRRRHREALAFWRDHEVAVAQLQQAILLSEVFGFGADPAEALEEIAALSDSFERPEELEFNLMGTALRTEGPEREDLSHELEQRIKLTFADFPERFPDSENLTAYEVDEDDPGKFLETIRPQLEARAEFGKAMMDEVRRGAAATAVLAAGSGRSLGEVWANLTALPLGYSDSTIGSEERAAAAGAVRNKAAVWDPTSIFVVGGLPKDLRNTLRNTLPASLVAESTFEDATSDSAKPADSTGGYIAYDADAGGFAMGEASEEERDREARRASGMSEMAHGFNVKADLQPEEGEEIYERYREEIENLSVAGRTWPATLAVARREGLAVFSDDRHVRLSARQMSIPAFGTLDLLDILAEEGSISEEWRYLARNEIFESGAWGLELSAEELVERAREAYFEPTVGAFAFLNDVCAWLGRGTEAIEVVLALLDAVYGERPEVFAKWVHRFVDSLTHSLGRDYETWARLLVQFALNPFREPPCISVPAAQALIEALRELEFFRFFPLKSDLVLDAIQESLGVAEDDRARAVYFRNLIDMLGPEDRDRAIATFVRDV